MALTWDFTEVENAKELCWIDNPNPDRKEDEKYMLNPITSALIHSSMLTGISKITKKNYKELAKRLVELEIVGMALVPYDSNTGVVSNSGESLRSPTEKEVQEHIGLTTNVTVKDTRKWKTNITRLIREQAERYMKARLNKDTEDK